MTDSDLHSLLQQCLDNVDCADSLGAYVAARSHTTHVHTRRIVEYSLGVMVVVACIIVVMQFYDSSVFLRLLRRATRRSGNTAANKNV